MNDGTDNDAGWILHLALTRGTVDKNRLHRGPRLLFLEGLIGYCLRRAQQVAYKAFHRALSGHKITPAQLGLLCKVADNPGMSQTELAHWMGLQRSALGLLVKKLVQQELILRYQHPHDQRTYALSLSTQGEAFMREIIPSVRAQDDQFAASLTEDERQELHRLLLKVIRGSL